MLVRHRRGRCPICGAPDCACGGPSTTVGVTITEAPKQTGLLVVVPLGRGVGIKVTQQVANKMRRQGESKEEDVG